ncbi:hypothetical protein D3C87_1351800 [compost metagenome]
MGLTADQPLCATLQGIRDPCSGDIERGLMHQRTDVDALLPIAHQCRSHPQLAHRGGKALEKGRVDRALDHDPVGRAAILAGGLELGLDRDLHRQRQIGIGADDERRVAAQLQRHFLHILGCRLQDQLTDAGRAGETH